MSDEPSVGVWIAENPLEGISRPGAYKACVMPLVRDGEVLESLDDCSLEECLAWARQRSDVILVRPSGVSEYLAAGTQPPWGPLRRWPVTPEDDEADASGALDAAESQPSSQWTMFSPGHADSMTLQQRRREHSSGVPRRDDDGWPVSELAPFPPWDCDEDAADHGNEIPRADALSKRTPTEKPSIWPA